MDPAVRDAELKEVLAVYVGSLAIDARVALFGDASLRIADRLLEAGAMAVHVWDPYRERALAEAARAPRGVSVQPYPPHDGSLPAADLVLVADLGLFDDPADVVALAREMTGDTGVAVIRGANRETAFAEAARAFDYYELFDLAAGAFSSVRMIAQLAFQGVALVALGDEAEEAPTVSVDTQLAEGERCVAAFVAVASDREISLDPYSIIELPAGEPEEEEPESPHPEAPSAEWQSELSDARALAETLEGRLVAQTARCTELEAELAVRADHLVRLQAEANAWRSAADAASISAAQIGELARRAAEAQALAERADLAEGHAATMQHELKASEDAHAAESVRLEAALLERAHALRSLEAELLRRDQMVRELVSSLGDAGAAGPSAAGQRPGPAVDAPEQVDPAQAGERFESADAREPLETDARARLEAGDRERQSLLEENARLRQQLDALALDLAHREADAHAAGWTVAELERRLAQRSEPPAGASEEGRGALSRALDELDALRRALAQEHAARVRVESGVELAQARSEIDRLSVLLEQHAAHERSVPGGRPATGEPVPPHPLP